jgi:hypothetical protein
MGMNSKNLALAVIPKAALDITTTSASSVNGTTIDLQALTSSAPQDIAFAVTATSLGTGTVSYKVQDSADNSTFADVTGATSPNLTAKQVYVISVGAARVRRYVRVVAVCGSVTNATIYAAFLGYSLREEPPNGTLNGTDFTVLGN